MDSNLFMSLSCISINTSFSDQKILISNQNGFLYQIKMNCNNNNIINSICSQIYRAVFLLIDTKINVTVTQIFSSSSYCSFAFSSVSKDHQLLSPLKDILHCFSFKVSEFTNEMYYCTRIHKKNRVTVNHYQIGYLSCCIGFFDLTKVKLVIQSNLVAVVFKNISLYRNMLIADRDSNKSRYCDAHSLSWLFNGLSFLLVIKLKS